jgi:hypothetical protein
MSEQATDQLVAAYINLRGTIQEKEDEIKALKEEQALITDHMLSLFSTEGIDSIRTPFGTVSRSARTNYWTSDWERMYEFIAEHNAYHLLEKRIHTKHMGEFLQENPDELPAGLQSNSKYIVSVRKPTKS